MSNRKVDYVQGLTDPAWDRALRSADAEEFKRLRNLARSRRDANAGKGPLSRAYNEGLLKRATQIARERGMDITKCY